MIALFVSALLTLTLAPAGASAQSVTAGIGAAVPGASPHAPHAARNAFEGWFAISGTAKGGVTFGVELASAPPRVSAATALSRAFGPLGNVTLEGSGALAVVRPLSSASPALSGEARASARGVLGPVALRAALTLFGAEPGLFRPAEGASDERPRFGAQAAGIELAVSGRPSRNLVLEGAPSLYLTGGAAALRFEALLRVLRAVGSSELRFMAHGFLTPGFEEGAAAVGAGVGFRRRSQPDVELMATLGVSPAGLKPGVKLTFGQVFGDLRVAGSAALEPYRLDVPALRLTGSARYSLPVREAARLAAPGSIPPSFPPEGSELLLEAAITAPLSGATAAEQGGSRGMRLGGGTTAWVGLSVRVPLAPR